LKFVILHVDEIPDTPLLPGCDSYDITRK